MSWQGIEGHDANVEGFRRRLLRGRLASTYLFVGPEGIGKRSFAVKLAKALLCQQRDEQLLDPCGICSDCVQVESATHPDLLHVAKPPGKSEMPVALFIGDVEHRNREGLCHDISLRPMMSMRRVAIIDDADAFNAESANCLLKTLEEPPPRSVMILIGTSAERQLPTIRSRSQIVRFNALPSDVVARLLVECGLIADRAEAQRLAAFSGGSLTQALELADPELWKFRANLLARLAEPAWDSVAVAKSVASVVDAVGKEASARRIRARQLIGFVIDYYRKLARALEGAAQTGDDELNAVATNAAQHWPGGAETAVDCAERSILAIEQVERNANQSTLIEAWLDDLAATISRSSRVVASPSR